MPSGTSGKQWVAKMKVDDWVQHFRTGREGFIKYISEDRTYMVIFFDGDQGGPCEEWRRCAAFSVKKEALPISIDLAIGL
jgi:hypothetical protein